jgi:tetratricopeptide (TPR) repeat protein
LTGQIWIALALIVAPMLPVLNLKVFHYEYIIQDRYLYLPSIGFCYLIAILVMQLAKVKKELAAALAVIIIVAFGAGTFAQNRVWHDAVALWRRAVHYSPDSWSTHYNLGLAYLDQRQYQPALNELLEAKRLNPREPTVLNNLALARAGAGDSLGAIPIVREALKLDPELIEGHNNLGAFLFDRKEFNEARIEFLEVLQRDPQSVSARFNLARTLASMGEHPSAIREFGIVLTQKPDDAQAHYELGLSLAAAGRKDDAIREIQRALSYETDSRARLEMNQKLAQLQNSK